MRRLLPLLLLLAGPASGAGVEPRLAAYVNDLNVDVYVALYGEAALELQGCPSAVAARSLLQLPAAAPVEETTLAALEADAGFGSHPGLPCDGAPFDAAWPATVPIWADVQGSGNYFLPALAGAGFYVLPAGCLELKRTLAIRERLQLPGVLQGMTAPPTDGPVIALGCGPGSEAGEAPQRAAGSGFSLHRFDTFLTPESTGDTIFVVRYLPEGGEPVYLPILRLDGNLTSAVILAGGEKAAVVETALRDLFRIGASEPVTALGAEAVSAVRSAVYADLCLTACEGYPYSSGTFLQPGIDLGLTQPVTLAATTGLDQTGAERITWTHAEGRSVSFTGCPALVAALGLAAAPLGDWMAEAGAALAEGAGGPVLDCRGAAPDVCVRSLTEGEPLLPARFALGDCTPGGALRIELPATVLAPQAIALASPSFASVELRPAPGIARARMIVRAAPASGGACILSGIETLIAAHNLPRLALTRIDLVREGAEAAGGAEIVGLAAENGTVALDGVTIGAGGEGLGPVARGISLCAADLYARGLRVEADALALQGVGARVLLSGAPADHASLGRGRFGVLLSASSLMRLAHVDVAADTGLVLRGAIVAGASVALAPASSTAAGSGLQVERGSSVELTTSTIAGFRCAASLLDAASSVTLLLPGNDVTASNTHTGCGAGRFSLIE